MQKQIRFVCATIVAYWLELHNASYVSESMTMVTNHSNHFAATDSTFVSQTLNVSGGTRLPAIKEPCPF